MHNYSPWVAGTNIERIEWSAKTINFFANLGNNYNKNHGILTRYAYVDKLKLDDASPKDAPIFSLGDKAKLTRNLSIDAAISALPISDAGVLFPENSGVKITANTAAGEVKFLSQGFTDAQASYLAEPYEGMGHHFFPRRFDLPEVISESPLNVLKPDGISRGDFYELHYQVDPYFNYAAFPRSIGGGWNGGLLGLQKYGLLGRVWFGSPAPLKLTIGGIATVGGGAAYWYLNDDH